jgi:hypothetical protein
MIRNKRGMLGLVLILVGAITLMTFVYGVSLGWGLSGDIFGTSATIWIKEDGRLECNKDQSPQSIIKYGDQDYKFTCGGDYLVDECLVYATCSGTPWYNPGCGGYYEKTSGDTKYGLSQNQNTLITKLSPGESITFKSKGSYWIGNNLNYLRIEYQFNPYRLYTIEDGGKYLTSSSDCCLANQKELQKNQFSYGDWDCIFKGEWRNYFLNWKQISGGKIYAYQGKEVICRTQALYTLNREKLADGTTRNIQGNKIKDVECCPHQDNNCDSSSFTFKQIGKEEERTCSFDYQCTNNGNPWNNPFSSTTAKIEKCVNGKCVEGTIAIECDSDAKCRSIYGTGYGCDLSFDNYGKCIIIGNIEQLRCGDGYCTTGETYVNCPEDCEIDCGELKLVRTEKKVGCAVGFPFYVGCDKQVIVECKADSTNYLLWIFVFLIIVIVGYFAYPYLLGYLNIGIAWIKTNPFIAVLILLAFLLFGGSFLV